MRTISVDTQGFIFSLKVLFSISAIALAWFAWGPAQQFFLQANQTANALLPELFANEELNENEEPQTTGRSIDINLIDNTVSLFEDTTLIGSFEIEKAPKQNSLEAMSEGMYTIDEKSKTKLSTVTMVTFPFFIQFGDTYALHGTPENATGAQFESSYVGGLLELSTWDAERVYAFAKEGMPVQVKTKKVLGDTTQLEKKDIIYTDLPATSAEAYALTDLSTGQTYLIKNGGDRYPIASITKLVTALVATDVIGHGAQVLAPDGEYYTLGDLYYPLILRSDNAVAEKIALHAGLPYFMSNMNAYVTSLGMTQSSFYDPSGLSPKNISTAIDLTILAQHLYKEKSFLLDITKEEDMVITSTEGSEWSMANQNSLASDPYFRGGKLGFTDEAGQTSLSIFTVPLSEEVHPIAVVILHSKDWKQDTRTLLRWLVETTK